MALSLLADYESTSSDGENEVTSTSNESANQLAPALEILSENSSISSSVFSNPYREAENYETSLLEKHVKMTAVKDTKSSVSERICYKFIKGKCKLGDKCRFLHKNLYNTNDSNTSDSEEQSMESNQKKGKKRCGLKDDLVPPKKFMKTYKDK